MKASIFYIAAVFAFLFGFYADPVEAKPQKACLKSSTGKIVVKRKCNKRKGQTRISAEVLQGLGASQVGPAGPEGPQGEQGVPGLPGAQGPQGPAGLLSVVTRTKDRSTVSRGTYTLDVLCDEGEVALSGGCRATTVVDDLVLFADNPRVETGSFPSDGETPTGWYCGWKKFDDSGTGFRAWALCAQLAE